MSVQFARKLAVDPRLRRRRARRQGARVDRRRGHRPARLERVAVRARTRRSPRRSRAPRRRTQPLPGSEREPAAPADRRAPRGRPGRRRGLQRLLRDPARRRRWRSASRGRRSSTPGRRSRCTRTWRRSRARARSGCRSTTATRTTSTRSRPRSRRRPSWSLICNPNNPTVTHLPAERIGEFCERVPDHVTVIVDEAYIEFQLDDDPDADRSTCGASFPNLVLPADVQQGLRPRRAAGRLRDLLAEVPRRGRRGAPAVQRQRDRPGGGGGGDPPRRRRRRRGSSATSSSG